MVLRKSPVMTPARLANDRQNVSNSQRESREIIFLYDQSWNVLENKACQKQLFTSMRIYY
jgi:hypothetical protein